jgi:hypothetical protein
LLAAIRSVAARDEYDESREVLILGAKARQPKSLEKGSRGADCGCSNNCAERVELIGA